MPRNRAFVTKQSAERSDRSAGDARPYGTRTPLVTITAHVAYGAIVGRFTSLAS
ncbi:MAG TPA: hypothetical protein VE777_14220 [Gaiellales bacterium]|jgi:hypothetical protein|nr:hypothetical protein [Gaiellales bacterium]